MRNGRKVNDQAWIQSSIDFNNWLKQNATLTAPPITLLDTTELTPQQAAEIVHEWIINRLI